MWAEAVPILELVLVTIIRISDLLFRSIHVVSLSSYSFQTSFGALSTGECADTESVISKNRIAIMRAPKPLCNYEPAAFHAVTPSLLKAIATL